MTDPEVVIFGPDSPTYSIPGYARLAALRQPDAAVRERLRAACNPHRLAAEVDEVEGRSVVRVFVDDDEVAHVDARLLPQEFVSAIAASGDDGDV